MAEVAYVPLGKVNADDANLSLGVECGERVQLAGQGQQGPQGTRTAIHLATVWVAAVRAVLVAYRSSGGCVAASVGTCAHADCDVTQPSESRQLPLMVSR